MEASCYMLMYAEYDGKPLQSLSQGVTGSDLCFNRIPLAALWESNL